jgi:hypothetical protein
MPAIRQDAFTVVSHTCVPGCPGQGEAATDPQARVSYEFHQEELEAQLARMLASRRLYSASFRPRWWWVCAPKAAEYRADPAAFEDPVDFTVSSVPMELWIKKSLNRRQIEATGRLRFLARQGLLQPWEEQLLLSRGGVGAQAVKDELAKRKGPRHETSHHGGN